MRGEEVLAKVRNLPISTWDYTSEGEGIRHLGPMAEDFYAAFGLGVGNTSIGVQDLASVSLAAVQALDARTAELESKNRELEQLRAEVAELRTANSALEQRVGAIEDLLKQR